MGYYILAIIIFLLALVFVSDLISNRNRDDDQYNSNFDHFMEKSQFDPKYSAESAEEILAKELASERGKANDIGVEPIYQNLEHQAFQVGINERDKELEDVLPEDPDEDDLKR